MAIRTYWTNEIPELPAENQQFEYQFVDTSRRATSRLSKKDLEPKIQEFAKTGWKVHTLTNISEDEYTILFERQIDLEITMKEHHLKGVHGSVSAPLLKVLELCALYLVALDEEFTHQEQTWIDFQFGRGAADRFIDQMPTTDWDSCLPNIHDLASQLDWQDARSLRFNSEGFFKALLQCDGMNKTEKERLDGLLQWIFEALPQDKAYDIITKMKK